MRIEIKEINDLNDGGCEVIMDCDEEATKLFINMGVIYAIEQGLVGVQKLWEEYRQTHNSDNDRDAGGTSSE